MKRIFVEKKPGFDAEARKVRADLHNVLGIDTEVRVFIKYDAEGIADEDFDRAVASVFSEPPVDNVYFDTLPISDGEILGSELLPGQYDQRADSAAQCVQLLTLKNKPEIKCATFYAFSSLKAGELEKIKKYLINPVECRESRLDAKDEPLHDSPALPEVVKGFIDMTEEKLFDYHKQMGFAMSCEDLAFVRSYFKSVGREPYITELKVIDTYWSDHCRHTTFFTHIEDVEITGKGKKIKEGYALYNEIFKSLYKDRQDKYPCLMDVATIGAKKLRKEGLAQLADYSEEINACSIKIKAEVDGKEEDWLVMFKNETHNHPTEIEPFGGAATCLGGAIRDPLSGRVYVYHAMRVSGAADIKAPLSATLKGKLAQRVISKTAAAGFSSYGNQIGLATGLVDEVYHEGYAAKRLEAGFVVGAARASGVVRERPSKDDVVILIGGRTGRDGCGGATGSSKAHTEASIEVCGAEVQKGNAITERKIQRLFRNPEVTVLIKRCNDFGAGGVSVAIGELAEGLEIDLTAVPKKYEGLDATELAISESQERMAVVVAKDSVQKIKDFCAKENLEATVVARVTDDAKLVMRYGDVKVVDISREFLDTNGVRQRASVKIEDEGEYSFELSKENKQLYSKKQYGELATKLLSDYNTASKKGMAEYFDSTIGAGSVLMPFGGRTQTTPSFAMAAKLPVMGQTDTATVASYAFYPYLTQRSPYLGGVYSVALSVIKAVITGAAYDTVYLTMQEFFEKLGKDPKRWGKPFSALLGALRAQTALEKAAIGGKDSMSGTFENIDVPPTVISFALGIARASKVIDNVIKSTGKIYRYKLGRDSEGMPDLEALKGFLKAFATEIERGNIQFATVTETGGAVSALVKSALGNGYGLSLNKSEDMFEPRLGDVMFMTKDEKAFNGFDVEVVGEATDMPSLKMGDSVVDNQALANAFNGVFAEVYPTTAPADGVAENVTCSKKAIAYKGASIARPRVFIPVFPGTNCEYDTARRFIKAGAEADIFVLKNRNQEELRESVKEMARRIAVSQIIAFPGGFSGGDEPDGSGKFIVNTFRNGLLAEAVNDLLYTRDGLIIGICNGFQALIKMGLLPYGKIGPMSADSPTLTYNNIKRHLSQIVDIRVASSLSPWLSATKPGEVYSVAISHGEGKFVADEAHIKRLIEGGQIATQYVDQKGNATMLSPFNPNGSVMAIEGITSPDGRILGKMGHSERIGADLHKNVSGVYDMKIFESGVKYFK